MIISPWSLERVAATQQNKAIKSCPTYGAGFVQVPGGDACVKIGGFVQGDAVAH
jgi:Porin subfamily